MTRSLGVLLLLAVAGRAAAEDVDTTRFWTDVEGVPAAAPGRTLRLDVAGLRRYLGSVPMESAQATPVPLVLPLPGGGFGRFEVVPGSRPTTGASRSRCRA